MAYFVVEGRRPKRNYLFILIAVFALPVTLFLMYQQQEIRQHAQQVTPIYLIPSSEKVSPGDKLAIALEIKTDVAPVKEVQVNLQYPQEKLSNPDISYGNSPFKVANEQVSGNGLIRIGRNAVIPVAGYNQIASLQFTAKDYLTLAEITLSPGSYVISDTNKSLPVNLVITNTSYYEENKPLNIKPLERLFDVLITIKTAIAERFPVFQK